MKCHGSSGIPRLPFSFHGALRGLEREPAADRKGRISPTLGGRQAGEQAGRAEARTPEPHRSSPPFGTIAILKGNLASRQVPFFRILDPCGSNGSQVSCVIPRWGLTDTDGPKYYVDTSRGARSERGGLRSYPLNLIRIMPAQGSQRDARLANALARFFYRRRWA